MRSKAFVISVTIHVAILGLCLLLTLRPPFPLPKEVSMEVAMADLGSTFQGSGKVSPDFIALPNTAVKQNSDFTAQPNYQPDAAPKELVTDDGSTTAVASSTAKNPKTATQSPTTETPTPTPERRVNTRALYPGSQGNSSGVEGGGSEGNGEGLGDRGNPDGEPGGKGVLGRGNGTWELAGRSLVKAASIESTVEEGIVVLKIWVDRRGKVFKAEPILAQCTTTSEYLISKAKRAALEAEYDPKPDAAPEQVGKMTFRFILR
ncbi:MAG TPA: hypothetical protein VFV37_09045 [Luteibaculaceae bacterium]|nr:hypothetical protein [Luteibaculaceae bacterium]